MIKTLRKIPTNQPIFSFIRSFSSEIDSLFNKSVKVINSPDNPKQVSNETKLRLYSLFKQAESGPCNIEKPGLFDPVGRAKYDAWKSLKDMSKDEAKQKYIDAVSHIFDGNLPSIEIEESEKEKETTTGKKFLPRTLSEIAFPKTLESSEAVSFKNINYNLKENGVLDIQLNRPNKGNSFDINTWEEFSEAFSLSKKEKNARVIVLSGSNSNFSTGMDLSVFVELQKLSSKVSCEGRKREGLMNFIQYLQDCISAPEVSPIPVIASISGHCIGGAVDLITACDLRYCTKDTIFQIKETDLAIVADIGTLQRLPKLIGHQQAAELCYTGKIFNGEEAYRLGLVSQCFDSEKEMEDYVNKVSTQIAEKSPLTIRGVKKTLLYARDHDVEDSLNQVKTWNSAFVLSNDLIEATRSFVSKQNPSFKEN